MRVTKIVTHDRKIFLCRTIEELGRFLSNYRTDEEARLRCEFPAQQFLVDHIEVVEMTKGEYWEYPATTGSAHYFRRS